MQSNRLFAIVRRPQDTGFVLVTEAPKAFHQLVYFVKDGRRFVTRETISSCIQFGTLHGCTGSGGVESVDDRHEDLAAAPAAAVPGPAGPMPALLRTLGGVYLPQLSAHDGAWPESARRELLAATHRFLAALTEAVHDASGRTVLYVPAVEALEGRPPGEAARDQGLTQRLESTAIHWTRQVRGALHKAQQHEGEGGRGARGAPGGPLAEIAFWRRRAEDLGGLSAQLASPGVAAIAAVLAAAGSGYLADFEAQRGAIVREAEAARDNVKYLRVLQAPCAALAAAAPVEVPALLPGVLAAVRLVWTHSQHYNTPDLVVGLLSRVAAEVVARCADAVRAADPLSTRGEAGVRAAMGALRECVTACGALRDCYAAAAAGIATSGPPQGRGWDGIDVAPAFPVLDAFQQRCLDLSDACEVQLQFVPVADSPPPPAAPGDQQPPRPGAAADAAPPPPTVGRGLVLPVFGGAHGAETEKSIVDIAASFQRLLVGLRRLGYDVLDVKAQRCGGGLGSSNSPSLDQGLAALPASGAQAARGTRLGAGPHGQPTPGPSGPPWAACL